MHGAAPPAQARRPVRGIPCSRHIQFCALDELLGVALEGPAGGRPPEDDVLDLAGEGEVLVGDPAGGMGLELHPKRDKQPVGAAPSRLVAFDELFRIAFKRSSGRTPQDRLLDLPREGEIFVGDATG